MKINLGFVLKFIYFNINPFIVRYYYKIYNQQITKVIKYLNQRGAFNKIYCKIYLIMNIIINKFLLLVGISETIRTQKK